MSDESTVLHGGESTDGSDPPPTTDVVEAPAEPEPLLVPQEILSNIVNPAKLTAMLRRKFGIRFYKIRVSDGLSRLLSQPSLNDQPVDLGSQLWEAMRHQHDPFVARESGMRFLPKGKLHEMINEVSVKWELLQHFPEQEAMTITDLICQPKEKEPNAEETKRPTSGPLREIFAILLLIELPHAVKDFIVAQVNDLDLPLHRIDDDSNIGQVKNNLGRRHDPEVPIKDIFKGWSSFQVENFERWQWSVMSPFFATGKNNVMHFEFKGGTIMPFCKQPKPPKLPGGSGVVCRVQIHEDHHDFDELVKGWVAVKQLKTEDETEFQREVEILKRVNKNPHDHLISLLATYRQHDRYHLMFPWADSNLMKYWQEVEPEPVFEKAVLWVAQQCRGITAALGKVHALAETRSWSTVLEEKEEGGDRKAEEGGLRLAMRHLLGFHGDIKPQNLLWFRDHQKLHRGTIRISDFGQAESNTGSVAHSPTYRPPECNLASRLVRRTYDIWSLGCVFLEFATWLLGGWRLVAEFRDKRGEYDDILCGSPDAFPSDHFWEIVQHDPSDIVAVRVKSAVTEFITELHTRDNCSEFMHEFLNMIELDMLLVESWKRSNCQKIRGRLDGLLQKCEKSQALATELAPWMPKMNENRPGLVPVEISVEHKDLWRITGRLARYKGPTPRKTVEPVS
ncbi:hypothetical protein F4680DRAFT_466665 [Xylaria scruposa]|nr:hypothetical protein F4680DRAFT_466665 [Xylaria scruposa]